MDLMDTTTPPAATTNVDDAMELTCAALGELVADAWDTGNAEAGDWSDLEEWTNDDHDDGDLVSAIEPCVSAAEPAAKPDQNAPGVMTMPPFVNLVFAWNDSTLFEIQETLLRTSAYTGDSKRPLGDPTLQRAPGLLFPRGVDLAAAIWQQKNKLGAPQQKLLEFRADLVRKAHEHAQTTRTRVKLQRTMSELRQSYETGSAHPLSLLRFPPGLRRLICSFLDVRSSIRMILRASSLHTSGLIGCARWETFERLFVYTVNVLRDRNRDNRELEEKARDSLHISEADNVQGKADDDESEEEEDEEDKLDQLARRETRLLKRMARQQAIAKGGKQRELDDIWTRLDKRDCDIGTREHGAIHGWKRVCMLARLFPHKSTLTPLLDRPSGCASWFFCNTDSFLVSAGFPRCTSITSLAVSLPLRDCNPIEQLSYIAAAFPRLEILTIDCSSSDYWAKRVTWRDVLGWVELRQAKHLQYLRVVRPEFDCGTLQEVACLRECVSDLKRRIGVHCLLMHGVRPILPAAQRAPLQNGGVMGAGAGAAAAGLFLNNFYAACAIGRAAQQQQDPLQQWEIDDI
jgi:hypothetical protein